MSRLNKTLIAQKKKKNETLIKLILIPVLLLLLSLVISSTWIRSPIKTLTPTPASSDSEAVPEWLENCVLHWTFSANHKDVDEDVDRFPYTTVSGFLKDEPLLQRCRDVTTQELAFPDTADGGFGVSPSDASPAVLGAIKRLVAKGHVKPFSRFEVLARVRGNWTISPRPHPPEKWFWTGPTLALHNYLDFKNAMEGNCTDIVTKKCYEDYGSCHQHSLEYWCHFFPIQDRIYP